MHAKLIIKICVFLILILLLILVVHIKTNKERKFDINSNNEIFTIRQKSNRRRKQDDINSWASEQSKDGRVNGSLSNEGNSGDGCSLAGGCPFRYHVSRNEEADWFVKNFEHLSPYSQWKKINKFISDNNQVDENENSNNKNGRNSKNNNNNNNNIINGETQGNQINKNSNNNSNNPNSRTPPYQRDDQIVIMTPISDAKEKLENYFKILCSLTYPHQLISVLLGEDSSADGTWYEAKAHVEKLRGCFNKIEVVRLIGKQMIPSGNSRHDHDYQLFRRSHLAMARNQLLMRGLGENRWVLWIDVDVKMAPPDLIEHLLSSRKDMVTANCLYRSPNGATDVYDRNTWRETDSSLRHLASKSPNFLMLEGYGQTERKFLNDLRFEEEEEEYDDDIDDGYDDDDDIEKVNVDNLNNVDSKHQGTNDDQVDGNEQESGFVENNFNTFPNNKIQDKNVETHSKQLTKINIRTNNKIKSKNHTKKRRKKKKRKVKKANILVKLDGVGACVLLVRADLHRKGLNFPPFIYDHHIETEAFAKMASSVYNTQPYGLPNVFIVHW